LAAGSWSAGSSRGIAAARAGELTAKNACCTGTANNVNPAPMTVTTPAESARKLTRSV
jgi:hypothetical protein